MNLEQKLQHMDAQERIYFLQSHADKVVEKSVAEPIEVDARNELEHQLSDLAIRIDDVNTEKKEIVSEYNERLKEMKAAAGELINELRTGQRVQVRKVFEVLNDESGMIEEYTEAGILVGSRRAPRNHQRGLRAVNEE